MRIKRQGSAGSAHRSHVGGDRYLRHPGLKECLDAEAVRLEKLLRRIQGGIRKKSKS